MNFSSIKQQNSYRTLLNSNLLQVECKSDKIQFVIFDFTHQDLFNHTQLLFQELQPRMVNDDSRKTVYDVFDDILVKTDELMRIQNNAIILIVKLPKTHETLTFELPLTQSKLSPTQSIAYLKQFTKAKQNVYKSQILRLKSKIYSLMTDLEDATNLIRSHSLQTKNLKELIKNLKSELQLLQDQKKKQQEISFIEVGVQHENQSQRNDIVEWLECPEVKQLSLDEEKLRNLTKFIENQIRQNQKIMNLTDSTLPDLKLMMRMSSSEKIIPSQEECRKEEEAHASHSYQNDCFFEKSSDRSRLQGYGLKTLEST